MFELSLREGGAYEKLARMVQLEIWCSLLFVPKILGLFFLVIYDG